MASFISGLVAFFKAIPILDNWIQQLIAAYVNACNEKTKAAIVDAAALSLRAKTQEDRFNAAAAWMKALSRDRVS
jgi:hypothetical protein